MADNRPQKIKDDWAVFEASVAERLRSLSDMRSSTIEDASLDADESGIFLILEGDLVVSMLKYLNIHDEEHPNYNKVIFKLDHYSYDKLTNELNDLRNNDYG